MCPLINTAQVTPREDFESPQGCRHPRVVRPGGSDYEVLAGCGQCGVCRRKRRQHWVGRCLLELDYRRYGQTFTLTYAPDVDECSYRDVQLFLKRVRREFPGQMSFITRGESGGQFGRWHWHQLAFGYPVQFPIKTLGHLEEWPHGHIFFDDLTPESIGYVYGYTEKENSWGETRYSARPCIGFHGMVRLAETLARHSRFAIAPPNFICQGNSYPMSYFMKKKVEDLMEGMGCIHVPGLSWDDLADQVAKYRSQVQKGVYDRPHKFAENYRRKLGPRPRKVVRDG